MAARFEIVPAETIATVLPPGLPALRFCRRRPAGPTLRLLAVGDVGLSGRVAAAGQAAGFKALLEPVSSLLQTADCVFGNLEAPLVKDAPANALFAAPPGAASALAATGFTLLHLANNHVYDHGPAGLATTLATLSAHHVDTLGAGVTPAAARQLVCLDTGMARIGWLGCGRTLVPQAESGPYFWEFDRQQLLAAVREARPAVDFLVVSIHIGLMYLDYPDPAHHEIARELVTAGVDLILMHHAHVLQGVEVAQAGPIVCYNLGNFLLDWQEGNVQSGVMVQEQNEGAVFLFDLDAQGICQAAALPTCVDEQCCVQWATGARGQRILHRLARISRDLDTDYSVSFRRQRVERNTGLALAVLWYHLRRGNGRIVLQILRQVRPQHLRQLWQWLQNAITTRLPDQQACPEASEGTTRLID